MPLGSQEKRRGPGWVSWTTGEEAIQREEAKPLDLARASETVAKAPLHFRARCPHSREGSPNMGYPLFLLQLG